MSSKLKKIYLRNFKSYGSPTYVEFGKKLTLIFGKNSVGKSSLIDAIKLSQQSKQEKGDLILNPSLSLQGKKNFGLFNNLIYKKNKKNLLEIGYFINEVFDDGQKSERGIIKKFTEKNNKIICSEVELFSPSDGNDDPFVSLKNDQIKTHVTLLQPFVSSKISKMDNERTWRGIYEAFLKNKKTILNRYEQNKKRYDKFTKLNNEAKVNDQAKAELDKMNQDIDYERIFQFEKKEIPKHLKFLKTKKISYEMFKENILRELKLNSYVFKDGKLYEGFDIYRENREVVSRFKKEDMMVLQKFDNLNSLLQFICHELTKIHTKDERMYIDADQFIDENKVTTTMNPKRMFKMCNSLFVNFFENLYIFSGQKVAPELYENFEGDKNFIGYNFENLPSVIENHKSEINKWLKHFDYDFKIMTEQVGSKSTIVHKKDGFKINFKFGGLGAESILPIISQVVALRGKTMIIEEPERRLHPGLQIKLADLFTECSKKDSQFIIETHSENFLLGICKNIRQKKISHEDVKILYAYMDNKGETKIDTLSLDENGSFIGTWRHGFFTEKLDLM